MSTSLGSLVGRLHGAVRRLRMSETGQGLVEYALIIAIVSLGAIASLTFLKGSITSLFSKAGSSINLVEAGSGGTGTGTGTGSGTGGSLPTVVTSLGGGNTFSPSGSVTGGGNSPYQGQTGVYTDNGGPVGAACSFPAGTATFTGVWIYHDTGSGSGNPWTVTGVGGSFEWACLNVAAPAVPQPGTLAITSPDDATPDDGDRLRATASGFTNSPTRYEFQWQADSVGNDADCTNATWSGTFATDEHTGGSANIDDEDAVGSTSNNYCYRVRARAENSVDWGPFSAYSTPIWVDDN